MGGRTFKVVNGDISDGYHTFEELYAHRVLLYLALARKSGWPAYYRCDFEGWFALYLETPDGQISYHVPNRYLDRVKMWASDADAKGYAFDGHTGQIVLERLEELTK